MERFRASVALKRKATNEARREAKPQAATKTAFRTALENGSITALFAAATLPYGVENGVRDVISEAKAAI